jgi:hypothetical protein
MPKKNPDRLPDLQLVPVSTLVNSPRHEKPECVLPI